MLLRQVLVVGLLAFISDVVACLHIKTLVANATVLAVSTVMFLHLAHFPSSHWFINNESAASRFYLTVAGAVGAGLGTLVVIWMST